MQSYRSPITEIQVTSSAVECSRLRKVICRLASDILLDPVAIADVELAIGEAMSNAVKYGVRDSKVSVRVDRSARGQLAVEMAYPGCKFDTAVSYPKDPRSGNGGFGRYIMQQVTDSMEYTFRNGRTTLRITKRR